MKRLIFIFTILLFSFPLIAQESFIIETSEGEKEVVIPEDMTPTDAFLEMAKLYWEERYDLEEALKQIDELIPKIEEYQREVARLEEERDKLEEENEKLVKRYEEALVEAQKPELFIPYVGIDGGWDFVNDIPAMGIEANLMIKERVIFGVGFDYPLIPRIQFGITF
jgi:hypothetical protein